MMENQIATKITDKPLQDEISESYGDYAIEVVTNRAVPGMDGMKPVQRRIIFAMSESGNTHANPFRKCARVVGDTMGKYHPHGDSSIYQALVKMGQWFGNNLTLIEPQGNFGSLDDSPAASRYTECRLEEGAEILLAEIGEEVVSFSQTYDGAGKEPDLLPARLPILLLNGAEGIAVGLTTKIDPHNLQEVCKALQLVVKNQIANKKTTAKQLMKILTGPDYPAGGEIIEADLKELYSTGEGSILLRAKLDTSSSKVIKIVQLPYQIGPEKAIESIQKAAEDGRLDGVKGVSNYSSIDGLDISIKLAGKADKEKVIKALFTYTALETRRNLIQTVLGLDGRPKVLGTVELLESFVNWRIDSLVKRSEYRKRKAEERLEIVEGYLIAIRDPEGIVKIIKEADTIDNARKKLKTAKKLTEKQVEVILEMRFRQIHNLEKDKLEAEAKQKKAIISECKELISKKAKRQEVFVAETKEASKKFGKPRNTEVISEQI